MKVFWPLLIAVCVSSCGESVTGPSAGRKGTRMAGDNYDPNAGTDTSNFPQDWWNQNAPTSAGAPLGPLPAGADPNAWPSGIPDPNHPGYDTHNYPLDPNGPYGPAGPDTTGRGPGTDPVFGTPIPGYGAPSPAAGPDQQAQPWGGPVAPFQYNPSGSGYPSFTPPPLPDQLKNPFQLPSAQDLQSSPGYMERFKMGQTARERAAAARGTILNGGTQQALTRYGQDYAQQGYNDLVGQKLNERQQQSQDYLNLAYGPAWQSNSAAVNQYGQLYKQYQDNVANQRGAQGDYWQQQMDLLNAGLRAASAGSPGSTGGQG